MADMMTFPDTVEEFMEQYKITDTEQIYTNGTELVPIFRMRQWFDHKSETTTQNVGEWIPHRSVFGGLGEKVYTCDKCGYNIGFQQENFCPNCGTRMNNK